MKSEEEKKWIDVIFRKQTQIISLKNILEIKFWSIIAAILGLLSYSYKFLPKELVSIYILERNEYLSQLTLFLILFWISWLLYSKTSSLYASKITFKDIFSAEVETLEDAIYTTLFLCAHLILIIHKDRIMYIGLFFPILILFILSVYMWIRAFSPRFKMEFLKREEYANIDLIKRIFFWITFISIVALIFFYILLLQNYRIDFFHDLKVAIFLFSLVSLSFLAKETWERMHNLPNLDSLEFEIVAKMFKSEDEILERYEKEVLGIDALLYIKNIISAEERELKKIMKKLKEINKEINKSKNKKKIEDLKIEKELLGEIDFKISCRQIKRYKDLAKELKLKDNEIRMIQKRIQRRVTPLIAEIRRLLRDSSLKK